MARTGKRRIVNRSLVDNLHGWRPLGKKTNFDGVIKLKQIKKNIRCTDVDSLNLSQDRGNGRALLIR